MNQPNPFKKERTLSLLKELAAKFIQSEAGPHSLITITDCVVSADYKRAKFFISVLPQKEEEFALDFVKRKRTELREFIRKSGGVARVPFIDFEIDKGEKNRQRIDELLEEGKNKESE